MIQLKVSLQNGNLVREKLHKVQKEIPNMAKLRMRFAMDQVIKRMQVYPPMRPKQRYKRTYRLRSHWRVVEISGKHPGFRVENSMSYAKYVVGGGYGTNQAWMHVGRWQVFRDVMEEETSKLPALIGSDIRMVARRNFG